jgi:signal transduction histidine kinase
VELVAGQIAERGVHVEITREPVWLYGERQRLVQLFQNLMDNAVKFMSDQPAPRIEIGAEQEEGDIVLFVRDNGMGIDPRHRAKLFGLFEKLDTNMPGSGIGLTTVQRIVKLHGGKIDAQSDGPGQGTTFRFTLAKSFLDGRPPPQTG